MATSEEGVSMAQAVAAGGPLLGANLGAQNPSQACHLQERNLVRQKYIVSEGRGEVVSQPPPVVREGPLNHPPPGRQLKAKPQAARTDMSRFHWHEGS